MINIYFLSLSAELSEKQERSKIPGSVCLGVYKVSLFGCLDSYSVFGS